MCLQQALPLDPGNPALEKFLIGAYVQTAAWGKAASLFDQIGGQSAAAGDPILLLWFAQTLLETGQSERLERELPSTAAGMTPPVLFSLGTLLAEHGSYQKAITYLKKIPESTADKAHVDLRLAIHICRNSTKHAETISSPSIKMPGMSMHTFGLDSITPLKERPEVPAVAVSSPRVDATARSLSYSLIEQLIQLEYFDTAQQVLVSSVQANPTDILLQVAAADLKRGKGDTSEAITAYRDVLIHQSGFAPALVGLARAEIAKGGRIQMYSSSLLAVLSRNPDDTAANGELGALESRGQDWSASEKHLRRAWAKDKSNVNHALALSRTYRHLSQPAEALKILEVIRPATKESSAFHLELAQVYTASSIKLQRRRQSAKQ